MQRARQKFRAYRAVTALAVGLLMIATGATAQERQGHGRLQPSDAPAYPTSPFHRAIDGDGRIIPCRCRFDGREFRLGEQVCMSTHVGTVVARCDLILNNTSWIPTETACSISRAPVSAPVEREVAACAGPNGWMAACRSGMAHTR